MVGMDNLSRASLFCDGVGMVTMNTDLKHFLLCMGGTIAALFLIVFTFAYVVPDKWKEEFVKAQVKAGTGVTI